MKILPLILIGLLVGCGAARGETMVVPANRENVEGTQSVSEPFGVEIGWRAQQVYGPSLFPVLPVSQSYRLSEMAFRFDAPTASFPSGDQATFDRVEIILSTSSLPFPSGFSPQMDQNHGVDRTTVFDQGVSLGGLIPAIGPAPFELRFAFAEPFDYDPTEGSLVLELRKYGSGDLAGFDAEFVSGARFFYGDLNGTFSDTYGDVALMTQFSFGIIPEPATVTLLLFGAILIGVRKRIGFRR